VSYSDPIRDAMLVVVKPPSHVLRHRNAWQRTAPRGDVWLRCELSLTGALLY